MNAGQYLVQPYRRLCAVIMGILILAICLWIPSVAADRYVVEDKGSFAPTGRPIEFSDRFGWRSYSLRFEFGFDEDSRRLTRKSKLDLEIAMRDGGAWKYRCRNIGEREMVANVNILYNRKVSLTVQCRIDPEKFARTVDMDAESVGEPALVFQVNISEGKAQPGVQKGLFIFASGQLDASEMNQYATRSGDLSDLAVLFVSEQPDPQRNP